MKPVICLITGPPGVGKSSVAKALVQAFPKAVRIDVDLLRHLVEKGYASPSWKTDEAGRQVRIAAENTCLLAENFAKAGFAVFIDDVVISKQRLDFFFKRLGNQNFCAFLLLLSDKKTLQKRDKARKKELVMGKRALQLLDAFNKRRSEKRWLVIDTTGQRPKQTANQILEALNQRV